MTSITVGTLDLRCALRAVAPHADPDPEFPMLHRVRCSIGPENLTVSATNRYTVGHALVSIWENGLGDLVDFDLSPTDVKEILSVFRAKSGSADDMPDATLMIEVDDHHTTVTDIAGLFPGKSLRLPKCPVEENYPNVATLLRAGLTREKDGGADRLITNGNMLGLFGKAVAAYGEQLVLDTSGATGAILITCSESFVGMLMPVRGDEDEHKRIDRWHADWLERLNDLVPAGSSGGGPS